MIAVRKSDAATVQILGHSTTCLSWDVVHMLHLHIAPTVSPLYPDINNASYSSMSEGYLHIIYPPLFSSLVFNTNILS